MNKAREILVALPKAERHFLWTTIGLWVLWQGGLFLAEHIFLGILVAQTVLVSILFPNKNPVTKLRKLIIAKLWNMRMGILRLLFLPVFYQMASIFVSSIPNNPDTTCQTE